jgi:hypothetical protein
MPDQPTKACTGCGEVKPLDQYSKDRHRPDGKCARCKACQSAKKKAQWADPDTRAKMSAANRRWHAENPERNTARTAKWWATHREDYKAARAAAGTPSAGSSAYHAERLIVLERADGQCECCGDDVPIKGFSVDHVIPTSRGGTHTLENLQLACRRCNSEKGTRLPWED